MDDTQRFDRLAGSWDEDAERVALATALAQQIRERLPLTREMDVLDFGCGTGLLTLALQPHVRSVTGADSSPGMIQVLAQKASAQGIGSVRTWLLDATHPLASAGSFDLVTSSMTLHHVRDLPALFDQFRLLLRPGGRVALADLDAEDGTFHDPDVRDVHHLGFDRTHFRRLLADAGFDGLEDSTAFVRHRDGREYPVFLVTGRVRPLAGSP